MLDLGADLSVRVSAPFPRHLSVSFVLAAHDTRLSKTAAFRGLMERRVVGFLSHAVF